jgi:monoamine oxidase
LPRVSRRHFLGAGTAVIAGSTLATRSADAATSRRLQTDVCVIGAGFSGLAAAYRLHQAGVGVVVLEARNRVGGRSLTAPLDGGGWVDYGGQWVGPTQDRFYALIKEMGGKNYASPDFGKTLERGILDLDTYDRIGNETTDRYPGADLVEGGFKLVDDLAASLDPQKPWAHPDAQRLDGVTFAQWLRENIANENARIMVGGEVSSIACASPEEISILQIASLVRACNGLDRLFATDGGAQQDRVIGGTQPIAQDIARRLGKAVRLGQPVRRIEWRDGATVHADRITVAARRVIVAIPPNLAGAIDYSPSLPTNRVQVTQRWPQGLVVKVQMIFAEPFWRADGLNGASLDYHSVVSETADSGMPDEHSRKGVLTAFIYAAHARKLAPLAPAERKKIVLMELAKRFGPKTLSPLDYHEMNWSTQQWTRGCFTGFLTPGATFLFGSAVRDPVGPLHWAGSENSTVWPSFIEGAIRSGEREAQAIIAVLK